MQVSNSQRWHLALEDVFWDIVLKSVRLIHHQNAIFPFHTVYKISLSLSLSLSLFLSLSLSCVRACVRAKSSEAVEYTDCLSAEGYKTPCNQSPVYDSKQSDGEAPVLLKLWRMWSTASLPSFPGPLWLSVVIPDRILSMS